MMRFIIISLIILFTSGYSEAQIAEKEVFNWKCGARVCTTEEKTQLDELQVTIKELEKYIFIINSYIDDDVYDRTMTHDLINGLKSLKNAMEESERKSVSVKKEVELTTTPQLK